ncbi:hypothetical protein [Aeromicrobium sp.]|uniref:hypothetical protein n=1 Tax=Aeromicrobium sp. TaxID=1871063 RepID=UPI003C3FCD07
MMIEAARPTAGLRVQGPGRAVTVVGILVALWCVGFAAVNVAFELTGRFDDGDLAEYSSGLTVMNWFVVGLKLLGAAVAVLSIARRPPRQMSTDALTVLVWGAFATLAVYALGSLVQAAGMVLEVRGSADQIDVLGVVYLLFFLAAATGYGVLALSYTGRHGLRKGPVALGVLVAPVLLAGIMLAAPAALTLMGLLPAT